MSLIMFSSARLKLSINICCKKCIKKKSLLYSLRTHWRLLTILKTSKRVYKVVFSYINVCILLKCIQCTINLDKAQMPKKFPSNKINERKIAFYSCKLQHSFTLICDSDMCWSTKYVFLKLRVVFSIFDSVSFLLKFIVFFQQNAWTV